ncbi:winged helix-turn-helix domain-containing protein [Vibrio sp. IB15]|uniref:Transcriptional regulator n=1 Tax=Vibrio chagasii TaxID=170679 RepID=A0A7V7NR56_9VIBR|nr:MULTISPECIES: winged helix-turn-helix domain-containing protein [Vibrio]KAB0476492.1 transcriptional regulator [Vibrio chagasii]MBJ2146787.1 winged helix-turn-helix domain-containing protein [Vibrio sp. IB15]
MIKFDPITNRIYNDDRSIKIGYRETRVLELLLKHAPDIVSKQDIINYAWGNEFIGDTSLAKSISLLRQKFVKLGTKDSPIVTVPKVGYRLIDHCVCIESTVDDTSITAPEDTTPPLPLPDSEVKATSGEKHNGTQALSVYRKIAYSKNLVCYFTASVLLAASIALAFSKFHDKSLHEVKPSDRLTEYWIGQLQIFQDPQMTLTPELKRLLNKYQCDCIAYISEEPGYSELAILNKVTRKSVNIFYNPSQLDKASKEIELFLGRGSL